LQKYPEGSARIAMGETVVLIAVSVEEGVRRFLEGTGRGWVTAEYAMHPRANPERKRREGWDGKLSGRSQEIQRLIGRALRAAVRLDRLGERTLHVDCDVLDADGGTRTASITGAFVALAMALEGLRARGLVEAGVLREPVAAVSVGLVDRVPLLDLCYQEDSRAQVDLNLVATTTGGIIEVQGTAEGEPMTRDEHDALVALGLAGVEQLATAQQRAIDALGIDLKRLME
jgi:ribonuclease PH